MFWFIIALLIGIVVVFCMNGFSFSCWMAEGFLMCGATICIVLFGCIFVFDITGGHNMINSFETTQSLIAFDNGEYMQTNDDEIAVRVENKDGSGFTEEVVSKEDIEYYYGDTRAIYMKGKKCAGQSDFMRFMFLTGNHDDCTEIEYDKVIITLPKE